MKHCFSKPALQYLRPVLRKLSQLPQEQLCPLLPRPVHRLSGWRTDETGEPQQVRTHTADAHPVPRRVQVTEPEVRYENGSLGKVFV